LPLQQEAWEKRAQEEVAEDERQQRLAAGLSGLKLTILALASIIWTALGSSTGIGR
jgi:hypothetical protein